MDFVDLKNKSAAELGQILSSEITELRALNFKARTRQLKQVHKIKEAKKTIARLRLLLGAKNND